MTEQQTPEPAPIVVDLSTPGLIHEERLAQLYAAYPEAKAKKDAAEAELKAVTDGIKSALTALSPDLTQTPRFELRGPGGTPLAMRWTVTNRFDSKRFAAEQPAVYESYRKPSGTWVLAPIKAGE